MAAIFTGLLLGFLVALPAIDCQAAVGKTILRIHGSNTVGAKLCPEIAKQFFSPQGYPQIKSEHGEKENALAVFARKDGRVHRIEIKTHGSSTGFACLESDQCDIAMDRGEPLEPVTEVWPGVVDDGA